MKSPATTHLLTAVRSFLHPKVLGNLVDRRFIILISFALASVTASNPVAAITIGLCNVDVTPQAPAPGGNPNVNVNIATCAADAFEIVEASLSGGLPVSIGPVSGTDSAAVAAALAEAAVLFGQPPSMLDVIGLSLLTESIDVIEDVAAASANIPPILGADYIGDPSDYSTWIALGPLDVEVVVSQVTVTSRTYRLDLAPAEQNVPLPATGLLLLVGLGGMIGARRRI